MASKKKYVVLNIEQRLEVLKDLEEMSLPFSKIGKLYGVNARTIQRIKKNAGKINAFAKKTEHEKKRRKIIEPVYDDLDKRLLAWFIENKAHRGQLSDALLLEKAKELKENLPSCSRFKVSRGWLTKFKIRHDIRLGRQYERSCNADQDDAKAYVDNLMKVIKDESINLENIYNMKESGLAWKALPMMAHERGEGEDISGYEIRKDIIGIGLCANALGTHKMMPLVIYGYKNPRALKHEVSLPVILKSRVDCRMDQKLFLDWYENHFKPSVRNYQTQKQVFGKVILLFENCETYKIASELKGDRDFKIMYLPPNITALIEPMSQGIMEYTKRIFRHKMLQRVLTYENGIDEFYDGYSLKNCIDMLSGSWSEITEPVIKNAWTKMVGDMIPLHPVELPFRQTDLQDMMSVITVDNCSEQHVRDFLTVCLKAEQRSEDEVTKGDLGSDKEPSEEPNEIIYQHHTESEEDELRCIFERLKFYSTRAPIHIQYIMQGLRTYFLGKER